jgi:hypothetical protein
VKALEMLTPVAAMFTVLAFKATSKSNQLALLLLKA